MGDVGVDIAEALSEVGTAFSILRTGQTLSGEFLKYEPNRQATKPFTREFFLEAAVAYNSSGEAGDVIEFNVTGSRYLIMNFTPMMFENEVIRNDAVLYKCNVSGELSRYSGEGWDASYRQSAVFTTVKTSCYALQVEPLFGKGMDEDEELGDLGLEKHQLYLPSAWGAQAGDRYEPVSGEYYKVESVVTRRYPGVVVVHLEKDTR